MTVDATNIDALTYEQKAMLGFLALLPAPLRGNADYVYGSPGDVVAQHGELYTPSGTHPRLFGRPGFCYFNARQVVKAHAGEFTYVEGYALTETMPIPTMHAWIVDRRGRAWDVTWDYENHTEFGRASKAVYMGVSVPFPVLREHWQSCGGSSFLADYYHAFPCLTVAYDRWRDDLPTVLAGIRATHCAGEVAAGRAVYRSDGELVHLEHIDL